MTPIEARTLDFVRERVEAGIAPTYREIAEAVGVSPPAARRIVERLERLGKLSRRASVERGIGLADAVDLSAVPSRDLLAELARRGETIDTLAGGARRPRDPNAATCAHDGCGLEVQRGHLFCRRHWFALPVDLRGRLLGAFSRRDCAAYQDAFSEAKLRLEGCWRGG